MTLDTTVARRTPVGAQTLSAPRVTSNLSKPTTLVTPMAGYYLVTLSEGICPRHHMVRKDKTCACDLGAVCPAVLAVVAYLKAGGQRAADAPAQHQIPACCPICGGAVKFAPLLCSPARGAGWACLSAAKQETRYQPASLHTPGEAHYWRFMWRELVHRITEGRVRL